MVVEDMKKNLAFRIFDLSGWKDMPNAKHGERYLIFDINNDGETELVVEHQYFFKGLHETNILNIFRNNFDIVNEYSVSSQLNRIGSIDFNSSIYCLDNGYLGNGKYDKSMIDPEDINNNLNYCIYAAVAAYPFILDGKYYLAIRDSYTEGRADWLLIARYISGDVSNRQRKKGEPMINKKSIEEECYFQY